MHRFLILTTFYRIYFYNQTSSKIKFRLKKYEIKLENGTEL